MSVRIERAVTSGTISPDGGTRDVDNNVWIIGDGSECIVIDAPHDAAAIVAAVAGRKVVALLLTHAHGDHIKAAREVSAATGAPIHLNPADRMLWDAVYPDAAPDAEVHDGVTFSVSGTTLTALHTPATPPVPCAATLRTWAQRSRLTRCSMAVPAQRAAPTATSRPS